MKSPFPFLAAGAAALAAACGPTGPSADAICRNANVVTADDEFSLGEAFAVVDGRFAAVGTEEEVASAFPGGPAEVVDLQGKTILPGCNDNHIHLGPGRTLQAWEDGLVPGLPAWSAAATEPDELFAALAACGKSHAAFERRCPVLPVGVPPEPRLCEALCVAFRLLDAGVRVSHGSDSAPCGPLITIWTAVTRRGFDGEVHGPEEAVTIEEAIRLHTREPACFTFEESEKGAIAEGMLADFVVLSGGILSVPPDTIRDLRVERTFIGGREIPR